MYVYISYKIYLQTHILKFQEIILRHYLFRPEKFSIRLASKSFFWCVCVFAFIYRYEKQQREILFTFHIQTDIHAQLCVCVEMSIWKMKTCIRMYTKIQSVRKENIITNNAHCHIDSLCLIRHNITTFRWLITHPLREKERYIRTVRQT